MLDKQVKRIKQLKGENQETMFRQDIFEKIIS